MFKAEGVMSVGRSDLRVGVIRPVRGSLAAERAVDAAAWPLWLQRVGSIAGLIAVVWIIPLFVLALPLALAWRAVLQVTRWRST